MIFTIPNSLGTTPLREENTCHLPGGSPTGGQFGPRGRCANIGDPARLNPATLETAPQEGPEITVREAIKSNEALVGDIDNLDSGTTRSEEKTRIAAELGAMIKDDPGLQAFYDEFRSEIRDYSNPDEYGEGSGAPDPEDVKGEWEQENEEAETEAYDSALEYASSEAQSKYESERDDTMEARRESYREALEAWQERDVLGDTSLVANLPFPEGPVGSTSTATFTAEEILAQWEEDGESAEFLSHYMPQELRSQLEELVTYDETRSNKSWSISSTAKLSDGMEQALLRGTDFEKHYLDLDWEDRVTAAKKFDIDLENIEPDYSDIPSFESWYEGKYGVDPDEWRPRATSGNIDADAVAAHLIHSWASTSGDAAKLPVALQLAVAEEFGLETSYTGEFLNRARREGLAEDPFVKSVEGILDRHGPFLRRFARAMYDNTQRDLKERGISELVVFRGVKGRPGSGLSGLLPVESPDGSGVFADLNLQPASSFSTKYWVARGFGRMVMVARVPASRVIGTCRSGWGCLSETEAVLLGGILKGSYVANMEDSQDPRYFWEDYARVYRKATAKG